jgi:hypothetical protein
MDRYLCDRLNELLLNRGAWLNAHPVDYTPNGVAKGYVISVFAEGMYKVLYRRMVSKEEFFTQTELWDDIFEEIRLVITFL